MRTLDVWGLAGLAVLISLGTAQADVTILHSFNGRDGKLPMAGLIQDAAGNLYGTASAGGDPNCVDIPLCGIVFKLAPDGTVKVLHEFVGGSDGAFPYAGLIQDAAGNLYGTTTQDGAGGRGTVFKLAPDGTETILHAFTGNDGRAPEAGLILDKAGNLYGTTTYGGGNTGCNPGQPDLGCGTVFRLGPDGTETVLHAFAGGSDGANPVAALIRDKAGNLYGTTYAGGSSSCAGGLGCGTVFKLAPDGTKTVLHYFGGGNDGANPAAGLMRDKGGNLYGTTYYGGRHAGCISPCGTVFRLAPDGTETILHAFTGKDGANPAAGLIEDAAGNLYGTTRRGGRSNTGSGTVFKLAPDGTETVLHAFAGNGDGDTPEAGLIKGTDGKLYGTTAEGGSHCPPVGCGTVFKVAK